MNPIVRPAAARRHSIWSRCPGQLPLNIGPRSNAESLQHWHRVTSARAWRAAVVPMARLCLEMVGKAERHFAGPLPAVGLKLHEPGDLTGRLGCA
jgi:hypothetical protein